MGDTTDDTTDDESTKDQPSPTLGDAGKRALDAERKARRDAERKAADLEARLGELEDRDKSDVTRLTEQVGRLTADLAAATVARDRLKVALDKGLTASQAKRLVGDTEEDLAADADELLADLGAARTKDDDPGDEPDPPAKGTPGQKPVVDLKPGSGTEQPADDVTDVRAIGERMFRS